MKKATVFAVMLIATCMISGCNRKMSLDIEEVQSSTLMIKKDGTVLSVTVEEFDKPYYTVQGLQEFAQRVVDDYNIDKEEEDRVSLSDVLVKDGMASMLISYKDITQYADINHIEAEVLSVEELQKREDVPNSFIEAQSGETIPSSKVFENNKLKALIVNESLDIVVSKDVLYYYNCAYLNNTSVQSGKDGMAVVLYK